MRSLRTFSALMSITLFAALNPAARADAELAVLTGHKGAVRSIAFARDGKSLVSLGKEDGKVMVWDVASHRLRATLPGRGALRMRLGPTGKMLAVSSSDYAVTLFDLSTATRVTTLKGHASRVYGMRFARDGKRLATADETNVVKLWDVATGKELQTIKPHADVINDLAFSGDGQWLATSSRDRTIKVWNAQTGKRARTINVERGPRAIAFTKDGALVGTDGVTLRTWDVATGKETARLGLHSGAAYVSATPSCVVCRDGKTVGVSNGWSEVRVVDLAGLRQKALASHETALLDFAFCPKDRFVAGAGNDGAVRLWDAQMVSSEQAKPLATVKEHTKAVNAVAFSPDGTVLASASEDGTVRLWEVAKMAE